MNFPTRKLPSRRTQQAVCSLCSQEGVCVTCLYTNGCTLSAHPTCVLQDVTNTFKFKASTSRMYCQSHYPPDEEPLTSSPPTSEPVSPVARSANGTTSRVRGSRGGRGDRSTVSIQTVQRSELSYNHLSENEYTISVSTSSALPPPGAHITEVESGESHIESSSPSGYDGSLARDQVRLLYLLYNAQLYDMINIVIHTVY